ncbi:MAG: ABC transporter permease [OCS116 cluster bacterium]|nr:ABC transporter permease [OCS116 cluster bacterium]
MDKILKNRAAHPFILLVFIIILIGILGGERVFTASTLFSVFQQFATLGPVSLALGMTMIVRHFDISVAGVMGLAGCVAVLLGAESPLFGIAAAMCLGLVSGAVQGTIIVKLKLSSIGVTLGGLLTLIGLAYVLTGNQELGYARFDISAYIDKPHSDFVSIRFLSALFIFFIASILISWTRYGRDILASGSNPKAASIAGVRVEAIVIGIFIISGVFSALGGALLSYSLAAASPVALSNILVPAAAAAIIGGVSLGGGNGHPIGIAGGVLVICVLQSGLTAIGVEPFVHDIAMGGVLLLVGILNGGDLVRRINDFKRKFIGVSQ